MPPSASRRLVRWLAAAAVIAAVGSAGFIHALNALQLWPADMPIVDLRL